MGSDSEGGPAGSPPGSPEGSPRRGEGGSARPDEASLIMTKRRKKIDPENLSLLLFLHNGWDLCRELEMLKLDL